MAKVLVLYYSSFGHIETMAHAVAEGARAQARQLTSSGCRRTSPTRSPRPTTSSSINPRRSPRSRNWRTMTRSSSARRLASAACHRRWAVSGSRPGQLWMSGALHGKVGGAFTSSATQHGGNETTLFSIIANLMHFGLVIVGLPYSHAGQMTLDEIVGGAPYGATTIAGGQGQRQPTKTRTRRRAASGRVDRQNRRQALGLVAARRSTS